MNKILRSEYCVILGIVLIFFALLPVFYLHQGSLFVDMGREFYIPSQMLKGQLLYKDILNIYGALGYQINTVLFLLFGEKITTLYHFGIFNSLIFVLTIYLISREFLEKQKSFLIAILTIFATVYTEYIFNTNLPYSYSFVYALTSFSLSTLFLIRYIKTSKSCLAVFSSLFMGISIAAKADFALGLPVLIYVFYFLKPLNLKNKILCCISFITVPLISLSVLFLQGVNFSEMHNTLVLILQMTHSEAFKVFYKSGLTIVSIQRRIISLLILSAVLFLSKYKIKFTDTNKILSYSISIVLLILISMLLIYFRFISFSALPILLFLLFAINFKEIYKDKAVFILAVLTILSGIKFSLYINTEHFGAFILPIFILAFVVTIKYFIKDEKHCNYFVTLLLCSIICASASKDFYFLQNKNILIKTPKGEIYATKREGSTFKQLSEFAQQNLNETDRILILPEGSFFNFAFSKESNNKYYSLIPLYVSMFGEQNIINDFPLNLPEYIVLHDLDESDFGQKYFCINYAQNLCKTISSNYKTVAFFNKTGYKMFVYKRKD